MKVYVTPGVWQFIKTAWRRATCRHTHLFTAPLPGAYWYYCGEDRSKGPHNTLRFVGCYICGAIRVEDFGA